MENRWVGRIPLFLAVTSFVLLLLGGTLVPIFSDELGWRMQERAWIDGGFDIGYSDLCGPNTIARAPWFMLPVRAFSAAMNLYLADPLFIRIEGVLCALAWTALLWMLTAQAVSSGPHRTNVRTLAFATLGLGFLPFILVISRPEQPLILTTTLAIVIALAKRPVTPSTLAVSLKLAAIVLLAVIALSYHLKGVLYSLIFLACLFTCPGRRRDWPLKLVAAAIVVALTVVATQYWFGRFHCPNQADAASVVATQMGAALLAGDVQALLAQVPQMLAGASPLNYVRLAVPTGEPMALWLPWGCFTHLQTIAVGVVLFLVWGMALTLAVIRVVNHLFSARLRAFAEPRAVLAIAILVVVLVWGASQLLRNVYEAAHVLPILMIFIVLCLGIPPWHQPSAKLLGWAALLAVPLSLVSQAFVVGRLGPSLYAASRQSGHPAGQPFSVSIAGYDSIRADVREAAFKCGPACKRDPVSGVIGV